MGHKTSPTGSRTHPTSQRTMHSLMCACLWIERTMHSWRRLFELLTNGAELEQLNAIFVDNATTAMAMPCDWWSPVECFLTSEAGDPINYIGNVQLRIRPNSDPEDLLTVSLRQGCPGLGAQSIHTVPFRTTVQTLSLFASHLVIFRITISFEGIGVP